MASIDFIWIGFDPRQVDAMAVARLSTIRHLPAMTRVSGLVLSQLRAKGLYTRPTKVMNRQLWDVLSDAPMSTEFACSRFLVPHLSPSGWALFMDCDVLVRRNLSDLAKLADPEKAVMVVKHRHDEPAATVKMDGQLQVPYARKYWSSVVLWNLDHEANKELTLHMVNTLPGRDLHRLCWLEDDLIGELPSEWNHLVGVDEPNPDASIAHLTLGLPSVRGYEHCEFADEWRAELHRWAA